MNVVYSVECVDCGGIYIGETGKSLGEAYKVIMSRKDALHEHVLKCRQIEEKLKFRPKILKIEKNVKKDAK